MTPVMIGNRRFRSKEAAKAECRRVRDGYALTSPVTGADDVAFLHDLITYHPESSEKIGCGIRQFEVHPWDHGTPGFGIRRVDGSLIDFSFITCVDQAALNGRESL